MIYVIDVDGPTGTECDDCGEIHKSATVQIEADSPEEAKARVRLDPRMHSWQSIERVRPVHDLRPEGGHESSESYLCECDCETLVMATVKQLRSGEITSCPSCGE